MLLRIFPQLIVGDEPLPKELGDQGEPSISLRVLDGRRLIAALAVYALRVAFRRESPHAVDLVATYQTLGYTFFFSPLRPLLVFRDGYFSKESPLPRSSHPSHSSALHWGHGCDRA